MIKHLGKGKRIRSALAIVLAASMLFSGNTLAFAAEDFEGSGEEIRQELSSAEDIVDEAGETAEAEKASETSSEVPADADTEAATIEESREEAFEEVGASEEDVVEESTGEPAVTEAVEAAAAEGEGTVVTKGDETKDITTPLNGVEVPGNENTLPAPTKLKAVITKKNQVSLSWKKVKRAKKYRIYRIKANGIADTTPIYEGKKPSYVDKNAEEATVETLAYKVMAYGTDDSGVLGQGYPAYTIAAPLITEVARTKDSDEEIALDIRYTSVKGAAGYEIFRANTKKSTYPSIAVVTPLNAEAREVIDGNSKVRSASGKKISLEKYKDSSDITELKYKYYKIKTRFYLAGVTEPVESDFSAFGRGRVTTRAPKLYSVSSNEGTSITLTFEDMEQATDINGNKLIKSTDYYQVYLQKNTGKYKKLEKVKASSSKLENEAVTRYEKKYLSEYEAKEQGFTNGAGYYDVPVKTDHYVKYTIENLTPLADYTVRIEVVKNKVEGAKSDEKKTHTNLSNIEKLKVKGTNMTTATLQWEKVKGATSYNVYYGEITEAQFKNATPATLSKVSYEKVNAKVEADKDDICTYTKTKLTNQTYYAFYVEPLYKSNVGHAGDKTVYVSAKTRIAAPDVKVTQKKYNRDNNKLTFTWEKIDKATGYKIRFIKGASAIGDLDTSPNWGESVKKGKNTTSFTVTGLKMGEPVAIRITTLRETGGAKDGDEEAMGNSYEAMEYACPEKPQIEGMLYNQPNMGADLRLKFKTPTYSTSVKGYQIWRSAKKNKGYEMIAEVTSSDVQFKDNTYLKDGSKAYYRIYSIVQGTDASGSSSKWKAVSREYTQQMYCNATSINDSDITIKEGETKEYTLGIKPSAATMKQVVEWSVSDGKTDSFTEGYTAAPGKTASNKYIKIQTTKFSSKFDEFSKDTIKLTGLKQGKSYIFVELANGVAATIKVNITEKSESGGESGNGGKGNGTIICLDPGHGGDDGGCASGKLKEKDLNLEISKKTKSYLEKAGFTVVMTRTSDKYVELEDRVKKAKDEGAKIIVSQHINSGTGSGVECYYSIDGTGKSLASKMCSKTASKTGMNNRGAKTKESTTNPGKDYYAIIRYARTSGSGEKAIAGIIMENGFIQKDYDTLQNKVDEIAKANADAIIDYYGD
ncbi:MAG: N-acetylmuramoyl-L-alanine amidase [Lachnospiraceae bacterium]|nr:N-acetylmuramoyl-L-alanine amidase [Lachnospiraceae bacterium]